MPLFTGIQIEARELIDRAERVPEAMMTRALEPVLREVERTYWVVGAKLDLERILAEQ